MHRPVPILAVVVLVAASAVTAHPQTGLWDRVVQIAIDGANFATGAAQGTGDMVRAYT